MAGSSPDMTLRGWRNTVRPAAGSYLGAYGVEPGDDAERLAEHDFRASRNIF